MKENVFSIDKNLDDVTRGKLNYFYQALFPSLYKIEEIKKGSEMDRDGIDIIFHLSENRNIMIQEKIRRDNYGDLLIEFWHNNLKTDKPEIGGKEGWYKKLQAELIVYLVPNWIYLIWTKGLRNFVENNQEILTKRNWIMAYNKEGNYWTYNKIIRWEEIPHKKYKF